MKVFLFTQILLLPINNDITLILMIAFNSIFIYAHYLYNLDKKEGDYVFEDYYECTPFDIILLEGGMIRQQVQN